MYYEMNVLKEINSKKDQIKKVLEIFLTFFLRRFFFDFKLINKQIKNEGKRTAYLNSNLRGT